MRNLFQQTDISVSDYKSEHASGYRYSVPLNGETYAVVMITEFEGVSVPCLYFEGRANTKEEERMCALVIEYECGRGNEWAEKMKRTAIALWDMMKAQNGEVMYSLSDRKVHIKPCIYDKEIKDATPADIEYYFVYDDVVNGGDTIFDVCKSIVNYDKELELYQSDIIELQKFFDEHCKEAWNKPYNELSEEEHQNLSFFSDWHKDVYGYRPRNSENNRCINKEQKEEGYER